MHLSGRPVVHPMSSPIAVPNPQAMPGPNGRSLQDVPHCSEQDEIKELRTGPRHGTLQIIGPVSSCYFVARNALIMKATEATNIIAVAAQPRMCRYAGKLNFPTTLELAEMNIKTNIRGTAISPFRTADKYSARIGSSPRKFIN